MPQTVHKIRKRKEKTTLPDNFKENNYSTPEIASSNPENVASEKEATFTDPPLPSTSNYPNKINMTNIFDEIKRRGKNSSSQNSEENI